MENAFTLHQINLLTLLLNCPCTRPEFAYLVLKSSTKTAGINNVLDDKREG